MAVKPELKVVSFVENAAANLQMSGTDSIIAVLFEEGNTKAAKRCDLLGAEQFFLGFMDHIRPHFA
ncbi:hypothetical protein [Ruegeria atlantica]|uniref:hypothetical protein n=1 Tax=Ruegeria atlantica TaxID=81569 RepID=UPI00071CBAA7|nr:hypothetical protein [Ruegeria atlantica]